MISNSVIQTLMQFIAIGVGLFLIPVFVGKLGSDLYGIWVISSIILGQLGLLDLGFTDGLIRGLSRAYAKNDMQELSRTIWVGFILLSLVGVIVSSLIFVTNDPIIRFFNITSEYISEAKGLLYATSLSALVAWQIRIGGILLQAAMLHRIYSVIQTVQSIVGTIILIFLVYLGESLFVMRIVQQGVLILGFFISIWVFNRKVNGFTLRWLGHWRRIVKEMFAFSVGMLYTRLMSMFSNQIQGLVIGKLLRELCQDFLVLFLLRFSILMH